MDQINKEEETALQKMFNYDTDELERLIADWNKVRSCQIKVSDVILDPDLLIIKNQEEKDIVKKLTCPICQGVARI